MKSLLALAVVVMAAGPAMASKARIAALSGAAHLEDTSTAITSPDELTRMGNWATLEMGKSSTTAGDEGFADDQPDVRAEGGFARSMGDSVYGFYLGNKTTWTANRKNSVNGSGAKAYLAEENPVDLYYASKMGDMAWGAGLHYSASDRKAAGKQSSIALNLGASTAAWDVTANIGLVDTAKNETANDEYKGALSFNLQGGYMMDSMYLYGIVSQNGYKNNNAGVDERDFSSMTFQLGVNQIQKFDGGEFFYGAAIAQTNSDDKKTAADDKNTSTTLPFIAGVEADAASWLAFRASITQNVLVGSSKSGSGDAVSTSNNTTVAAGVGLKFGKATLDATLESATQATGKLNGDTLLASTGLTYMW